MGHVQNEKPPAMKRTVTWLTEEQLARIGALSQRTDAPVSALIRRAVAEYLSTTLDSTRAEEKENS